MRPKCMGGGGGEEGVGFSVAALQVGSGSGKLDRGVTVALNHLAIAATQSQSLAPAHRPTVKILRSLLLPQWSLCLPLLITYESTAACYVRNCETFADYMPRSSAYRYAGLAAVLGHFGLGLYATA